jgi:hypothetical protein
MKDIFSLNVTGQESQAMSKVDHIWGKTSMKYLPVNIE